ncbi:spermatogenesis-defective protein 39 homolog isoform X2 [Panonychus citri]|uniref:spermatogenesis-defective protein 39 homolog isoform X2 n=1 Tax=Panonychus citri TaxID=50023 RepID=UPI00230819D0|nr:spermatogenesis-defective protein 39 homolog isoform X2 [Panonychus citri]XP_053211384.1 spermatogenesis-defective protein 39 homolog isoform X2 [Panonychus citri]
MASIFTDIDSLCDQKQFTSTSPKPTEILSKPHVPDTIKLMSPEEAVERVNQSIQKISSKNYSTSGSTSKIDACVKQLVNGENPNLSIFKSKEDKLSLLETAINTYDGDAIIAVIIFLEKTLCWRIFAMELLIRPTAVDHYIDLLRETNRSKDLTDFLAMLGRSEEAAIVNYSIAIKCQHMETKIKHLKHCYNNFFKDLQDELYCPTIMEQITLFEYQLPVDSADSKVMEANERFESLPPGSSFLGSSVVSTLFYSIVHHSKNPPTHFGSPQTIRNNHNISDKQYYWTALRALAKTKRWNEIDQLFHYQTFLGSKKIRNIIPFERVVRTLGNEGAPQPLINTYLKLVDDDDVKLKLTQEYLR